LVANEGNLHITEWSALQDFLEDDTPRWLPLRVNNKTDIQKLREDAERLGAVGILELLEISEEDELSEELKVEALIGRELYIPISYISLGNPSSMDTSSPSLVAHHCKRYTWRVPKNRHTSRAWYAARPERPNQTRRFLLSTDCFKRGDISCCIMSYKFKTSLISITAFHRRTTLEFSRIRPLSL
jgi:hypothetical protein